MIDYFFCIYGDCENCKKNINSVFVCDKYGVCDYCIAELTEFCEVCKHYINDIRQKGS